MLMLQSEGNESDGEREKTNRGKWTHMYKDADLNTGPVPLEQYKQAIVEELEIWTEGGVVNIFWSILFL